MVVLHQRYGKLYENVVEFRANRDQWLHGAFSEVKPEEVEDSADSTWRNLYVAMSTLLTPPSLNHPWLS